jgi:hypothetical protein
MDFSEIVQNYACSTTNSEIITLLYRQKPSATLPSPKAKPESHCKSSYDMDREPCGLEEQTVKLFGSNDL